MLDARCWLLDAGCSMLDARYWMLDAGCSILDAGYRHSAFGFRHQAFGKKVYGRRQTAKANRLEIRGSQNFE